MHSSKMALLLLILMSAILCGHTSESQIIIPSLSGHGVGRGPHYSGLCENSNYIPIDNRFSASYNQYETTNCPEIQSSCRCVTNNMADRLGLERLSDYNGNGALEGAELERTLKMADYNMDWCVSPDETADHDRPLYGWSGELLHDYAVYVAILLGRCDGLSIPVIQQLPPITLDRQRINILSFTIRWCEANRNRYKTNCDCAQLPDTCVKSRYRDLPECHDYIYRIKDREGCIFSSLKKSVYGDYARDLPSGSHDYMGEQPSGSHDHIGDKPSHGSHGQGKRPSTDLYDSGRRSPSRGYEITGQLPSTHSYGRTGDGQVIIFQNYGSGSYPPENRRNGGILDR